ncbi:hypothetical protein LZ31DRAFT_561224 [Colletotrichum somersetense]|nr:hypothetical protein LZ31DRAFT_561224 [Colletotrichum somersetense]
MRSAHREPACKTMCEPLCTPPRNIPLGTTDWSCPTSTVRGRGLVAVMDSAEGGGYVAADTRLDNYRGCGGRAAARQKRLHVDTDHDSCESFARHLITTHTHTHTHPS